MTKSLLGAHHGVNKNMRYFKMHIICYATLKMPLPIAITYIDVLKVSSTIGINTAVSWTSQ